MNYHIVRTNETIEKIALLYNLSVTEIKSINQHISAWHNLIPGTKLRLPEIPESVNLELTDVEPFIEDYYPKINKEAIVNTEEHEEVPRTPAEEEAIPVSQEVKKSSAEEAKEEKGPTYPPYFFNPYGYYPNPYAYYYSAYRRPQVIRSGQKPKPQKPS